MGLILLGVVTTLAVAIAVAVWCLLRNQKLLDEAGGLRHESDAPKALVDELEAWLKRKNEGDQQ
jgi:hypothetical protein